MRYPLPEEILAMREAAGHSQKTASAIVGYGYRAWQEWEGGRSLMPPSLYQLYRLKTEFKELVNEKAEKAIVEKFNEIIGE